MASRAGSPQKGDDSAGLLQTHDKAAPVLMALQLELPLWPEAFDSRIDAGQGTIGRQDIEKSCPKTIIVLYTVPLS